MTRGQITQDLKNLIGDGVAVDDSGLNTWVNDAYGQIVDRIIEIVPDYYYKKYQFATIESQQEYEMPEDFEVPSTINWNVDGTEQKVWPMADANMRMIPIKEKDTPQGWTNATPGYYLLGRMTLGLMPVPQNTGETVTVYYQYSPAELIEDDDLPDFPTRYHHIIKFLAYANYLDQDDEHAAAERMRQRFDFMVERMMDNISTRQTDQPKSVVITQNADLYGGYYNDGSGYY